MNRLYFEGKQRSRHSILLLIGLILSAHKLSEHKEYKNVKAKQVMDEVEKGEIPILPIIGVILISIAFALFLSSPH